MLKRLSFLLLTFLSFYLVQAQVNASFNANQTSGCPNPFLLILSDNSTAPGPINSWAWTLTGPAGFTTQTSATNQLSTTLLLPGFYTVELTVCSGGICDTEIQTNFIEVFARPSVTMAISPLTGCPPLEVCFDGTFTAGCGVITSSLIDVRDGTVYANVEDVCHVYPNQGTFTNFTVSATNSCGCVTTESFSDVVTVSPAPQASFTSTNPFSCTAPLAVNFTNTSSNTSAGTVYEWNIPPLVNGVGTQNVSESFSVGSYDVQLIVTNPNGCSDTASQTNYVEVGNPVANFGSNLSEVCPGTAISFSDSSSGSPISWAWVFEGHGTSSSQSPTINFTTPGSWGVSLVVQYQGGCSDSVYQPNFITVNSLPVNNFSVSDSGSCVIPFTTAFTNASSNATSTTWTFPGGTPATFSGNGPVNVSYNSFGTYNVQMSSTSLEGCTTNSTFTNVIGVNPLVATIVADSSGGCVPFSTNLSFTLSSGEIAATQSWTLPGSDILSSSNPNPAVVYNASGCNDVTLDVTTVSGCTTTVTTNDVVCAGVPPTGGFTVAPTSICFEQEDVFVTYTGAGADTILWDFGDSQPPVLAADDVSVGHAYSDDLGSYTITMIPFQFGCPGDTTVYVDTVDILGPIAAFDAVFDGCSNWNTFNFTDQSLEADSVFYDFGDPTSVLDSSSSLDPSWIYPALDTITLYSVTQFAYNFTTGCEHQTTSVIRVYPPDADFTTSAVNGCAPRVINFQNNSLEFTTAGGNTQWNFQYAGAGSPITVDGWQRNFTYSTPGVYTVAMRSRDLRGCWDTIVKPDLLTIHGVNANFSQDSTVGCAPFTVNFTDSSNAPVTGIASWFWDFGVPVIASDTSILENPAYTYSTPGLYTVTLTATDSFGCTDVSTSIVDVTGSVASFTLSDTFFCTNQNIGIVDASLGDSLSYNWTFTNGTPASSTNPNPPALSYATEGFQDILLEVVDPNGCFADTTVTIPVFDVVAQASASIDSISCFANITAISFNNTSFNNIDSSSVLWDLGNGTTSTLFNPSAIYNLAGNYVVSMSIASNTGCRDTTIVDTIFVGGPYAEISVLNNDTGCLCETKTFELVTWNAATPSFISGDGGLVSFVPSGLLGDTIRDTISYQYCQAGNWFPAVFIDDGTCSGNVELSDTISIDSLNVGFGIEPFSLCDSGTVCFNDSSFNLINGTNGLVSWFWDFGDGDTASVPNVCHTYSQPGLYDVSLVVTNVFGCIDTAIQQVLIPQSPQVTFETSQPNGCIGITLGFLDSTVVDSNSAIQSWHWDFGDPSILTDTSNLQNPSYTFNSAGLNTVVLIVTDTFGCTGSDSSVVEVFPVPIVQTTPDTILCLGDTINPISSGALNYVWSPNFSISDDSIASPLIYPTIDTTYVLEGTDVNGCSSFDTLSIDVKEIMAYFGATEVCLNEVTAFSDSSTSDGLITNWNWNFDEPSSGLNDTSTLQNPTHEYLSPGLFNVNLSVVDDNLCSADTTIAIEVLSGPTASFTADSVCFGENHTFNSDSSNSGGANIVSYHWDFGVSGTLTDTSNIANTVFTYNAPGLYTVCLTIVSDQACLGNVDDTCMIVQVYELPNANFSVDTACFGNQNSFTDLSQGGVDAGLLNAFWDFNQNPEDTLELFNSPFDAQFMYDTTGQYNVGLTVVDSNFCEQTTNDIANVFPNPVADFSFSSICQNEDNDFVSLPAIGSSANLTYYWDFDEGLGFQVGDSLEVYAFVQTGNHLISHVIVDAFGCTDTTQQTINVLNAPSAVITGDNSVCRGISTALTGASSTVSAPPAIYDWSVTSSQTSTITYSPNVDTRVFLTVTDGNGCSDTTSIFVDVLETPDVDFDWSDACEDLSFSLTSEVLEGDGILTNYTWNINSPILGSTSLFTPNINYLVPDVDTLTVTLIVGDANGCIDSLTQTIIVDEQVQITVVTPDYLLCPGDSLLLDLGDTAQFTGNGIGSVLWSPSIGVSDINGDSITLNPDNSTTYTLTAFSTLGQCPPDDDNIINVEVGPSPLITVDAVPNPVLVGAISNVSAGVVPFNVNTDSLIWDNSSGTLNASFGFNIEATPIEETTYPIELIYYFDSLRCVSDTSITISVITACDGEIIYVPNIFTPNDDGKNDEFKITGYGIEVINYLRIFDRWGQLMFEGIDTELNNGRMPPGSGWLGDNKGGKDCNSGVYVYTYELICANGDVIRGSGNVTLIK